ncbi:MAG: hypothetical protein ACREPM_24320 [Gemmatimonadaceae bacterium]
MRTGDFAVEVIPTPNGRVRELESGHVLARPGMVYTLRLRNFGPLHCVADVDLDGRRVTAGGLVLRPWSFTDLERPLDDDEDGRFTVVAEGDETAFGLDGGRDNELLGVIDASFRRELPRADRRVEPPPVMAMPTIRRLPAEFQYSRIDSLLAPDFGVLREAEATFERAAGTGLTGHSDQEFEPAYLGPLEQEATRIRLRLVIGSEAAIAETPAAPTERAAPARPAARP